MTFDFASIICFILFFVSLGMLGLIDLSIKPLCVTATVTSFMLAWLVVSHNNRVITERDSKIVDVASVGPFQVSVIDGDLINLTKTFGQIYGDKVVVKYYDGAWSYGIYYDSFWEILEDETIKVECE